MFRNHINDTVVCASLQKYGSRFLWVFFFFFFCLSNTRQWEKCELSGKRRCVGAKADLVSFFFQWKVANASSKSQTLS